MPFSPWTSADSDPALDEVHNYYERLVFDRLRTSPLQLDADALADLACIALNQLPAKYIRHAVDFLHFTDASEIAAMKANVQRAVESAIRRMTSPDWEKRN